METHSYQSSSCYKLCSLQVGRCVASLAICKIAKLGCKKCLKLFPHRGGQGSTTVYGGSDRENWNIRSNLQHREAVKQLKHEKTIKALHKAESNSGVRYSLFSATLSMLFQSRAIYNSWPDAWSFLRICKTFKICVEKFVWFRAVWRGQRRFQSSFI